MLAFTGSLFSGINIESLESLEGVDRDVGDERVELVGGVLVFVAFTVESHAHAVLHVTHTVLPDSLVQAGVDSHV